MATGLTGQLGDVDIRLLRIYRSVVECEGFSAAQVELGMSVSAVSIAIGDLEKRLGMKLCHRGRAGFSLTDQGAEIYQATLKLLASLENFRTEANSIQARLRGEFNIGITDNLVTMYEHMRITNSLAALKRRGPELRINIRMMPPPEIEKNVLDGRLHVGVIPSLKVLSGLGYMDLYGEESRLYCGHLHPLFSQDPARLESCDFQREDAVILSGGVPDEARGLMQGMHAAATASDREGVAFLVLSGEYIGFLPTHYAERWVNEGRMRALLPDRWRYQTNYTAVTRKGARPHLILQTYLEELGRAKNDRPGF